jgi:hypothetical protein
VRDVVVIGEVWKLRVVPAVGRHRARLAPRDIGVSIDWNRCQKAFLDVAMLGFDSIE